MGVTNILSDYNNGNMTAPGTWVTRCLGERVINNAGDRGDMPIRRPGTIRRLRLIATLSQYDGQGAFQVNRTNTALVVSITSGATGVYENTSDEIAVVASDEMSYESSVIGPDTSGTNRHSVWKVEFVPTNPHQTVSFLGAAYNLDSGGAVVNNGFVPLTGLVSDEDPETERTDLQLRGSYTWRNLWCFTDSNTRTQNLTITSDINGTNGNQQITVTAATTGFFEDTTNTDEVASGDVIKCEVASGGTGNFTLVTFSSLLVSTDGGFIHGNASVLGVSLNDGLTRQSMLGGGSLESTTATTNANQEFDLGNFTLQRMRIYIRSNGLTSGGSEFDLMINDVGGNQQLSIPFGLTGFFESDQQDDISDGDVLRWRMFSTVSASSWAISRGFIQKGGAPPLSEPADLFWQPPIVRVAGGRR